MNLPDINTLDLLLFGLPIVSVSGLYCFGFLKKSLAFYPHRSKNHRKVEHELAASLVEIKDQNLNYLGHELHEDVAQKLSVARLLTNRIKLSDQSDRNVTEINMLIGECIQDIRNLSAAFIKRQPDEMCFMELLENEIDRIRRSDFCTVDFTVNNPNLELNKTRGLILFRLIQTALNEFLDFSTSKKIRIIIKDKPKNIKIEIGDNAIDFYKFVEANGPILLRMSNRAKIIEADFQINPVPGMGTRITIVYNK